MISRSIFCFHINKLLSLHAQDVWKVSIWLMLSERFYFILELVTTVATEFRLCNKNKTGFSLKDLYLMFIGEMFFSML